MARIAWALLLACVAALSAVAFGAGIVTGAIDGPARGADLVRLSERPVLFCFQAALHLAIAACAGAAAYKLSKQVKREER